MMEKFGHVYLQWPRRPVNTFIPVDPSSSPLLPDTGPPPPPADSWVFNTVSTPLSCVCGELAKNLGNSGSLNCTFRYLHMFGLRIHEHDLYVIFSPTV